MIKRLLPALCLMFTVYSHAQDDLLKDLDSTQVETTYATAAFKGLQVVTLQSTKMPAAKEWYVVVSHRFGTVKNGIDTFFGLDNATTKLGAVYGVTDGFALSFSRHTMLKMYEGSAKLRLSRQSTAFPLEIVAYSTIDVNTFLEKENYPRIEFTDRLSFVQQLLISRKVNESISLELVPSFIHRNLHDASLEKENQVSIAAGGRVKITKRMSINMEYAYNFDQPDYYKKPLSIGLDVETGGHVFQMVFSNSQAMTESGYLTNAAGNWGKGDFFFGFNLYRVF